MRTLLADDHGIVRRGLRSLLEEAGGAAVAELMQKLGLHNTAEIVLYAVRKGIIR